LTAGLGRARIGGLHFSVDRPLRTLNEKAKRLRLGDSLGILAQAL